MLPEKNLSYIYVGMDMLRYSWAIQDSKLAKMIGNLQH